MKSPYAGGTENDMLEMADGKWYAEEIGGGKLWCKSCESGVQNMHMSRTDFP